MIGSNNLSDNILPINALYTNREDFSIIGLTGIAGSGCSRLAEIMSNAEFFRSANIRSAEGLPMEDTNSLINSDIFLKKEEHLNDSAISKLVFRKKFNICQKFIEKNYKPYTVIKYTYVIWLYVFLYLRIECKKNGFVFSSDFLKKKLNEILIDKFALSHNKIDEEYRKYRKYEENEILHAGLLEKIDFSVIVQSLCDFNEENFLEARGDSARQIAELFFSEDEQTRGFQGFVRHLNAFLAERDYVCLCRLYHRLSTVIRATGDPLVKSKDVYGNKNKYKNCDYLYSIVELINVLIKGKKAINKEDGRRIVIDSIRNSLEALYLKERYYGFYLVAVHDNKNRLLHLNEKIKSILSSGDTENEPDEELVKRICERIEHLAIAEASNKDYECGRFYSPNIAQCIADAEIHILNNYPPEEKIPEFYTMEEQWMKYASLLLHPGLITPSAEERCMVVAYTAKLNSGCLSRQVGAVITNQYHSIRTIGWNDVPYGQVPCALRDLNDLLDSTVPEKNHLKYTYSDFEREGTANYDKQTMTFKQKLRYDYAKVNMDTLRGLPFSYCFKTLENRYSGNKNQVYTRSLHAEENAMMQMVKFGGESLKNGIIYVTASPCELCSKKLYQIGVRKIVYIDPYPGIAKEHIVGCGYKRPELKLFQGAYGGSYFKLFQPFMPYKDELDIRTNSSHQLHSAQEILEAFMKKNSKEVKATYTEAEFEQIMEIINHSSYECKDDVRK